MLEQEGLSLVHQFIEVVLEPPGRHESEEACAAVPSGPPEPEQQTVEDAEAGITDAAGPVAQPAASGLGWPVPGWWAGSQDQWKWRWRWRWEQQWSVCDVV